MKQLNTLGIRISTNKATLCVHFFLFFPLLLPLEELSGCMSVRIKEAPRPQSSECCQQANSPSLIALYPPPTPTHLKKGNRILLFQTFVGNFWYAKMSQWARERKERNFNDVQHDSIFLKCRMESTEKPVTDYCFFFCLPLSLPLSSSKVHWETFKKAPELKVMSVKLPTLRVSAPANLISLH